MEWIVSSDVKAETWRRLLEFANKDVAIKHLESIHGKSKDRSQTRNYTKHSEQIRVSLVQAKEYFDSSENSSIYTSSNQLFYGLYALTTAVMLCRGSGEYALDVLRRYPSKRKHGLSFNTSANLSDCRASLHLLEMSQVEILADGHFVTWCSVLPDKQLVYALVRRSSEGNSFSVGKEPMAYESLTHVASMTGVKTSIIDLIKRLPDMTTELFRFDIPVYVSRASYEVNQDSSSPVNVYKWDLHSSSNETTLKRILSKFRFVGSNPEDGRLLIKEAGRFASVVFASEKDNQVSSPSMRDAIFDEKYIFYEDLDTHELCDIYRVAFGLSMLSRYYPDLWIRAIESHCQSSKIIQHFVQTAILKAPALSLELIQNYRTVIAPFRPSWYS